MKRGITILVCVLAAGVAVAQSPEIIRNTKAMMDGVSNNATKASNEALGITAPAAPSLSKEAGKPSPAGASASPKASGSKPATAATKNAGVAKTAVKPTAPKAASAKAAAPPKAAPQAAKAAPATAPAAVSSAVKPAAAPADPSKASDNKWPLTGKRDPFVSPVVYQTGASNCTGGKKCLEIGQINFRGVVRSENGFIAVVTNGLNKAYFLRENDPVFDGYVVKITDDSIVFQETMQDRLGKTFTREVVKKLTTPSV